MRFAELSDEQWEFIKPHIPPQPIVGRKRADDRKTINGILYVLITGCCWHDMPRCYGAYQTAWRRLKRWSKEGVWNRILAAAQEQAYAIGKLSLETVAVDKHAHRFKKGGESVRYNGHKRRKGVKAHAVVSSESLPLAIILGDGNEHDSRRFKQVVSRVRINTGKGRPKTRPEEVLADAAYDTESIRCYLRRRGIKSSIPSNKRNQKKSPRGRPTRFDNESYKKRGAVEQFFGWLKLGFR